MEEKEIDLLYIFRGIKNYISKAIQYIKKFIVFSLANIKIILTFIFISVGITLGLHFLKKKVYVSTLTISHKRLNNGQCMDLINSLTKTPKKDTVLKTKLGLDFQTAKQIKKIEYRSLNQTNNSDSLFNISDFKIEVQVYNTGVLDSLQFKILNYLESNEYATKRKEINKLYLDKLEERINIQIKEIDSLKKIVDGSILPRSLGNGIIFGETIDPVKVYQEGMILSQSQLKINEERELNDSFEIVLGFSSPLPVSNLILNLFIGIIIGLIFAYLWLLRKLYSNIKPH